MQVAEAIAHAMQREGIDTIFTYPVNPIIEAAAVADIRTIVVRQEPSAGEASPTADAQGSAGNSPSLGRASMQGAFSRGSIPDR